MAKIGGYTLALDMTDRQAQVLKTDIKTVLGSETLRC